MLDNECGEDVQIVKEEFTQSPKKKKWVLPVCIAVVTVVVIAVLICFFVFGGFMNTNENIKFDVIDAYVDAHGNAFICYGDGKVAELGNDVVDAYMTPDRRKIIFVDTNEDVYWTDAELSDNHLIYDNEKYERSDVWIVTDNFVILSFRDAHKGEKLLYRFDEGTIETLAIIDDWKEYTEYAFNINYDPGKVCVGVAVNGKIKVVTAGEGLVKEISSYQNGEKCDVIGMSTDGKTVAWTVSRNGEYSVVLYDDGKEQVVASGHNDVPDITAGNWRDYESQYIDETYDVSKYATSEEYINYLSDLWSKEMHDTDGNFDVIAAKYVRDYFISVSEAPEFSMSVSPNNQLAVIMGDKSSVIVDGDNIKKVKLPSSIYPYSIYTTNGVPLYMDENASIAQGYYVWTYRNAEDNGPLYCIDFDSGKASLLADDVSGVVYWGEKLIYSEPDGDATIATVDVAKGELCDKHDLGDVCGQYLILGSRKYLYYTDNYSEKSDTYDLKVYDYRTGDIRLIASGVDYMVRVSVDSESVYYFTDVKCLHDIHYGTLKVYNMDSEKEKTIMSSVVVGSLSSGLVKGINPRSIWFDKYFENNEDVYNLNACYYDGVKAEAVVKDLKYWYEKEN